MNSITRTILAGTCCVLAGCAAGSPGLDAQRRLTAVGAPGYLAPEVRNAILDGRLLLGMSEEMVAASWGLPRFVGVRRYGGLTRETWEYGARQARGWETTLTFEGGTLIALERSRAPGSPDLWGGFSAPDYDFRRATHPMPAGRSRGLGP